MIYSCQTNHSWDVRLSPTQVQGGWGYVWKWFTIKICTQRDKWKSILVCHECCGLSINILPHCCLLQINGEHTAYKKFAANMANQMLTIAFRCDCCIHCHLQCRAIKNTLVLWPSSCSLFTKGRKLKFRASRSKEFGIAGQAKSFSRFHSHQTTHICSCNHFKRCLRPTSNTHCTHMHYSSFHTPT